MFATRGNSKTPPALGTVRSVRYGGLSLLKLLKWAIFFLLSLSSLAFRHCARLGTWGGLKTMTWPYCPELQKSTVSHLMLLHGGKNRFNGQAIRQSASVLCCHMSQTDLTRLAFSPICCRAGYITPRLPVPGRIESL